MSEPSLPESRVNLPSCPLHFCCKQANTALEGTGTQKVLKATFAFKKDF